MKIVIAIDDLHPEQGWGCEGDESVGYIEELNKEYGCKFTLFIPSHYHNEEGASVLDNPDWCKFWLDKDWVEIAAHGHIHDNYDKDMGEQEFLNLDWIQSMVKIINIMSFWQVLDYSPKGFRAPGWGVNSQSAIAIGECFDWVAAHNVINKGIDFGCDTFYGCDGIHETDNINLWDNRFMFQSHIAGDWNDNCWNEENYINFRNILEYLSTQYKLSYKTMSEL